MSVATFPLSSSPAIAEHAFQGLPRAPRSLPRPEHAMTQLYLLCVDSSPNPPVSLELHLRQDGRWFWEYSDCRFGQPLYPGVFDGYALWPREPHTYPSAQDAHAGLLAEVLATFPQRAGSLQLRCAR